MGRLIGKGTIEIRCKSRSLIILLNVLNLPIGQKTLIKLNLIFLPGNQIGLEILCQST